MDTIAIRRATRMTSKESNSRFDRAIALLQADFKITPIGISDSGSWRYAFIYDLVHRYYPEILVKARSICDDDARDTLATKYFESVGAAQMRDILRLFQWSRVDMEKTLKNLIKTEIITEGIQHPTIDGEWFALKSLI